MQSLTKLSIFLYLIVFGKYASSQNTTSLYYPGQDSSATGEFLLATVAGSAGGTTTFLLAIENGTLNAQLPATPTYTLVEASNTAHLFANILLNNAGDVLGVDTQCKIVGNVSTCQEVGSDIVNGTTITMVTTSFTETVSAIAAMLVTSLPAATPAPAPTTNGSNPSSPSSHAGSSTSPGVSPTNKPNGASYLTASAFLCAVPVVAVLLMLL